MGEGVVVEERHLELGRHQKCPGDFQALETWPAGARVGQKHRRQVRAAKEERDAVACSCHLTTGLDDFHSPSFSASHTPGDKWGFF